MCCCCVSSNIEDPATSTKRRVSSPSPRRACVPLGPDEEQNPVDPQPTSDTISPQLEGSPPTPAAAGDERSQVAQCGQPQYGPGIILVQEAHPEPRIDLTRTPDSLSPNLPQSVSRPFTPEVKECEPELSGKRVTFAPTLEVPPLEVSPPRKANPLGVKRPKTSRGPMSGCQLMRTIDIVQPLPPGHLPAPGAGGHGKTNPACRMYPDTPVDAVSCPDVGSLTSSATTQRPPRLPAPSADVDLVSQPPQGRKVRRFYPPEGPKFYLITRAHSLTPTKSCIIMSYYPESQRCSFEDRLCESNTSLGQHHWRIPQQHLPSNLRVLLDAEFNQPDLKLPIGPTNGDDSDSEFDF